MRDPARIPIVLGLIGRIWARHPDLRLTQLIVNAMQPVSAPAPEIYYMEDEWLVAILDKYDKGGK